MSDGTKMDVMYQKEILELSNKMLAQADHKSAGVTISALLLSVARTRKLYNSTELGINENITAAMLFDAMKHWAGLVDNFDEQNLTANIISEH